MPYTPQEQPTTRDDDNGVASGEEKTKRTSTPLPVKASSVFVSFCGAATERKGGGRREGGWEGGKERRKDDGSEGGKERNPIVAALKFP